MHVDNYITYVQRPEDEPYLKTPLLDVNMRLFNNVKNPVYRTLVKNCCEYLRFVALQEMDGYKKPHGMSGANIAIPWNIIAVVRNRNKHDEYCEILINPRIIKSSDERVEATTNCGSIRLAEPIKVWRHTWVTVMYHTEDGKEAIGTFNRESGSFTIQHEIEHNQGILITDLERSDVLI